MSKEKPSYETIRKDLLGLCEDNEVMKDTINEYFDNKPYWCDICDNLEPEYHIENFIINYAHDDEDRKPLLDFLQYYIKNNYHKSPEHYEEADEINIPTLLREISEAEKKRANYRKDLIEYIKSKMANKGRIEVEPNTYSITDENEEVWWVEAMEEHFLHLEYDGLESSIDLEELTTEDLFCYILPAFADLEKGGKI